MLSDKFLLNIYRIFSVASFYDLKIKFTCLTVSPLHEAIDVSAIS